MTTRHPRAILNVLGQTVECEDISIKLSRDSKSDTLNATAPLYGDGPSANFWSTANKMAVKCQITDGLGKSGQLFDGIIDSVELDFGAGKVTISARDKVSKMIDKKSSKKHLNKKPHEIVKQYAGDNGLSCDADSVSEKAGRSFQIDYVALTHRMSDWHAVQHIAESHGMAAYATGGKVYFKKLPEKLPVYSVFFSPPTLAAAQGNELRLTGKRNCALGKTIKSTVHTWNHKNQKKYIATSVETGGGGTLEYQHHHPGLTQEQANSRAKSHLDKATRHELEVHIEVPGDPTIQARMNVQVSGTNSAFDQLHEISSIEHKISQHGGYITTIDAKSKSKKRGK